MLERHVHSDPDRAVRDERGVPGQVWPDIRRQPRLLRHTHPPVREVAQPLVLGDLVPATLNELERAEQVDVWVRLAGHQCPHLGPVVRIQRRISLGPVEQEPVIDHLASLDRLAEVVHLAQQLGVVATCR